MEFRFAHVTLRKPIVLAVVGTGFEWEGTEVKTLLIPCFSRLGLRHLVITCQQFEHKHILVLDAGHITY